VRSGIRGNLGGTVADHIPANQCHRDDLGRIVTGLVEFSSDGEEQAPPAKAAGSRRVRATFSLKNRTDRRILLLVLHC